MIFFYKWKLKCSFYTEKKNFNVFFKKSDIKAKKSQTRQIKMIFKMFEQMRVYKWKRTW